MLFSFLFRMISVVAKVVCTWLQCVLVAVLACWVCTFSFSMQEMCFLLYQESPVAALPDHTQGHVGQCWESNPEPHACKAGTFH